MPSVGTRIGAYELRGVVESGEIGTLYVTRHRMLDTKHALELLHPRPDERYVHALIEAARLQATVVHPNVVRLTDCGMFEERPFVVSDWVDGRTLADWLDRYGPFPIPAALKLAREIARGVGAIHEARIVHRDVTPATVWIDKRLVPRITGFGRAKRMMVRELAGADVPEPPHPCRPEYTAPEAEDPGESDFRSDLWSLGVLLYELVTNEVPFEGLNPTDTLAIARSGAYPSIAERRPDLDVPPAVDELVAHLLRVDPSERIGSTRDLLARLDLV
ncbi:MAG: serine/threonine-protein kinase [Myxococcota bacterium]